MCPGVHYVMKSRLYHTISKVYVFLLCCPPVLGSSLPEGEWEWEGEEEYVGYKYEDTTDEEEQTNTPNIKSFSYFMIFKI